MGCHARLSSCSAAPICRNGLGPKLFVQCSGRIAAVSVCRDGSCFESDRSRLSVGFSRADREKWDVVARHAVFARCRTIGDVDFGLRNLAIASLVFGGCRAGCCSDRTWVAAGSYPTTLVDRGSGWSGVPFGARFGASASPWDYAIHLFCGLLPWTMFQEAVLQSSTTIVSHANLVKRVVFPLETLPIAQTLSGAVT